MTHKRGKSQRAPLRIGPDQQGHPRRRDKGTKDRNVQTQRRAGALSVDDERLGDPRPSGRSRLEGPGAVRTMGSSREKMRGGSQTEQGPRGCPRHVSRDDGVSSRRTQKSHSTVRIVPKKRRGTGTRRFLRNPLPRAAIRPARFRHAEPPPPHPAQRIRSLTRRREWARAITIIGCR